MKNKDVQKKRKPLFLPSVLSFLVLLIAAAVFGVVRYFLLTGDGATSREALFRVLWETVPALAVLLAFGLVMLILLAASVVRPLKKMRTSASRIAERVEHHEPAVAVAGAGCVGALSQTLEEEEKELSALLARVAQQTDEQVTEREKRRAALAVCAAAVPERIDLAALTYGVHTCTLHSSSVGADLCDGFALDDRRMCVAIGDVWERGLPAALFSAWLLRGLREQMHKGRSPAAALSALNKLAYERGDGMAATLFCAVLDSVSGELRYANAGHLPPVVAGETSGFLRMRAGTPLGLYADAEFTDETFALRPGQGLIAYTDGVVNALNGREYFGYDRLLSAVGEHFGNALKTDGVAEDIALAAKDFGALKEDDCAVLALFFPAGAHRLLAPELSELEKMRELLEHWLHEDPRKKNIELACEEIFTNIVNHAGAKTIRIGCEREENSLIIRFTDDGEPFNPLQAENGEKDFYSYAEGGMGMTIIRRIAGEIFYRTQQNQNVLTVRFPVIKGI